MLILILAWIYISFICLAWGNILFKIGCRLMQSPASALETEISIILLIGLSTVGCIAMYISLFVPLDWKVQVFFLLISLVYYCIPRSRKLAFTQVRSLTHSITLAGLIFFSLSLLLILLINSYIIIHPDTLAYHAQAIRWIEDYAATPGIVHLRRELGFQSVWFVLQAAFSFKTTTAPMSFFAGGAVLAWALIFTVQKLGRPFSRNLSLGTESNATSWLVFVTLIYSFVSWTQIRLTAASASPDFITSLYILATIYCFLKSGLAPEQNKIYFFISCLFALTSICIKLSATVIFILPLSSLLLFALKKCRRDFLVILSLMLIICLPLLARNYIASGWPLFPSRLFDLFNPDWKFDKNSVLDLQHYIKAYARFPATNSDSERVFSMPIEDWFVPWWQHLVLADKSIMIAVMVLITINLFFIRKFLAKTKLSLGIAISTLILALIIWFMNAPDPRFASGFLLSLLYCLTIPWKSAFDLFMGEKARKIFVFAVFIFLACLLSYAVYRIFRYFEPSQIVYPMGIKRTEYKTIICGNLRINVINAERDDCGSTPPPCIMDSCWNFEPRGDKLEEGFRKKGLGSKGGP